MAAHMKERGVVRRTARCGGCYRQVSIDAPWARSKYTHLCYGGKS